MSNSSAAGGVCLACKHDPGCMYEAAAGCAILECAQFEIGFLANGARNGSVRDVPFGDGRGLCSNCEHRETCIYPRPDGGVWRCEEYM